jgi:hypothetical protein
VASIHEKLASSPVRTICAIDVSADPSAADHVQPLVIAVLRTDGRAVAIGTVKMVTIPQRQRLIPS